MAFKPPLRAWGHDHVCQITSETAERPPFQSNKLAAVLGDDKYFTYPLLYAPPNTNEPTPIIKDSGFV
jgi:hypothetical protein